MLKKGVVMLKRIVGTVLGFIFAFSAVSCKAKEKENKEKAKRYRIEVDGKTVAENLTFEEAREKSSEFVDGEKVKIFEQK